VKAIYILPRPLAEITFAELTAREHTIGASGFSDMPNTNGLVIMDLAWLADSWAVRDAFEGNPDVIVLGEPWEPLPPAALAPLEALRAFSVASRAEERAVKVPVRDSDTVGKALRKALPRLLDAA